MPLIDGKFYCDKNNLNKYKNGVILDRKGDKYFICDQKEAQAAIDYMEKGGLVYFIKKYDGRIISTCKLVDGKYIEKRYRKRKE